MELKGQIEEFIFQNETNNYTIAILVKEDLEPITVVGYLPFISVGDTVKLNGKMVVHQEYGEQFKIDSFEKMMPENAEALERYLASGTIKGIGPATARKIIEKFGDETLSIFKLEPLRLAEVRGITKDTNISLISIIGVNNKPGEAFKVFSKLANNNIDVNVIIQSIGNGKQKPYSS